MLYFESDYMEGAHPAVLKALADTNLVSVSGYGADRFTASAADKIRAACGDPRADVFFLVGGTQTNAVVIGAFLSPWQGVVAAASGHIAVHEAGAIEAGGHKVLTLPHHDGRLDAEELRRYLDAYFSDANREHMVEPGMVYLSHPTEYGTLYTRAELAAIAAVCRERSIPLYLDGARLGYALASPASDLTLRDIAALCDVFYIGGTKVGALCGEAAVFPRGGMPRRFLSLAKRGGALLAKGRLLGVQFDALFTDDLYLTLSRHAIRMAERLRQVLTARGYPLWIDSPTNQQFVLMENRRLPTLAEKVAFSRFEPAGADHTVVRFVTSWATRPEDIDALADIL